jgi:16S rRNA C967 or C1407 C5-methylase (RsmB/RsmF family)
VVNWYPIPDICYCFDELSRPELRQSEKLKNLHRFIVDEVEAGRIFRQEKVSMIPVTLLKIEPKHSVLDMCAAPGSKTIQILEYLHAGGEKVIDGFVIANDTDAQRAYMLTHQARRLNSPALYVTQNDARIYPNLKEGS